MLPEAGSGGPNPFVPMKDAHPMFPTLIEMREALQVSYVIVRKPEWDFLFDLLS